MRGGVWRGHAWRHCCPDVGGLEGMEREDNSPLILSVFFNNLLFWVRFISRGYRGASE